MLYAGTTAAFMCWSQLHKKQHPDEDLGITNRMMLAAYGGSMVMRTASKAAFDKHGRAMMAGSIIPELHAAFTKWFEQPQSTL